ncbi:MAG TPA: hypothetical protein VM261_18165 [Kofleriaceae bacterium]|nr:hypothetical protein [Kofleriaceae bacterium]
MELPGDIDGLVTRGLDRYRAGDVDGALTAWEAALAIDPTEPRALGYVDYVRQNYDELSGGSTEALSEMLIPFGLARSDDDEGDDYEISITGGGELDDEAVVAAETGHFKAVDPLAERTVAGPRAGAAAWAPPAIDTAPEPSIDDGWGLDAESEPTWFTGPAKNALAFAVSATANVDESTNAGRAWGDVGDDDRTRDFAHAKISFPPAFSLEVPLLPPELAGDVAPELANDPAKDPSGESALDLSGESTLELSRAVTNDFGIDFTGERTTERATAKIGPEMLMSLGVAPVAERRAGSEEMTTEGWPHAGFDLAAPAAPAAPPARPPHPAVEEPVVEPLPPTERFDDQGTADLKVKIRAVAEDDRRPIEIEDLHLPPPRSSTNQVDDESRDESRDTGGRALTADEDITARLSSEIDQGAPARETNDDRARRRITMLLERARNAADTEDHSTAVAAIDLALSEAPDVAAAQKLVHRSRDLILDCYYRFFGNLDKVPVLAAPLSELTRRPLDTRAAFLLSRIDGTLTFEEILDVAGMGRLEACRHLAHLLWRGIIST